MRKPDLMPWHCRVTPDLEQLCTKTLLYFILTSSLKPSSYAFCVKLAALGSSGCASILILHCVRSFQFLKK
ncbi:hypothetical protein BJX65DRAFT_265857 [Aspergillus insuetus]